jgi:3-deoxy-D-manno-octulosonate 8-phosphate phosphatase (KDO 8-P phosphatase)
MRFVERCRRIQLILSDVDGVLTNGGIIFTNDGVELKQFHIRDGLGIRLWQRASYKFGLVTGRSSHIVKVRAAELGIEIVRQGYEQKWQAVLEIANSLNLGLEQICFVGDDLPDLPVISRVGLGIAVADAVPEVRAAAHYITSVPGGQGAVRELIEIILKSQNRWEGIVAKYLAE